MKLVDELVRIYLNEETWHQTKLSEAEAKAYYEVALTKGRVLAYQSEDGELLGYVESWLIDFGQFGRILCHLPFDISREDIQSGPICYVAGTWIKPSERGFKATIFKYLVSQFFRQNFHAEFFVGEARRKKTAPLKVLKRTEAIKKYLGDM